MCACAYVRAHIAPTGRRGDRQGVYANLTIELYDILDSKFFRIWGAIYAACTLALALSVYAGWRDWRNDRRRELLLRARHAAVHAPEVLWDAPEDE